MVEKKGWTMDEKYRWYNWSSNMDYYLHLTQCRHCQVLTLRKKSTINIVFRFLLVWTKISWWYPSLLYLSYSYSVTNPLNILSCKWAQSKARQKWRAKGQQRKMSVPMTSPSFHWPQSETRSMSLLGLFNLLTLLLWNHRRCTEQV